MSVSAIRCAQIPVQMDIHLKNYETDNSYMRIAERLMGRVINDHEIINKISNGKLNVKCKTLCHLIYTFDCPLILIFPNGEGWIAEEETVSRAWSTYIKTFEGAPEIFGRIWGFRGGPGNLEQFCSMIISPDKSNPDLGMFLLLTDPRSCRQIKTVEEYHNLNMDSRGHENPQRMKHWMRILTGTDPGPIDLEQFLRFLATSKKGQFYYSIGHGKVAFDIVLERLHTISSEKREILETRYKQLIAEHEENFHSILEGIIEDLVNAAMAT